MAKGVPLAQANHKEAVILKVSIFEWTRETRFLLEGKLAHEWVLEAERAWQSIERAGNGKHVVIDLCGVSFVDRAGEQLLLQSPQPIERLVLRSYDGRKWTVLPVPAFIDQCEISALRRAA